MAALTGDRKTTTAMPGLREFPVAAGVVIYEGALVVLDNAGYARPGRASTTDIACVGICDYERVDNSGGSAGAKWVKVRSDKIAYVNNSLSGDLIALDDVGGLAFIADDNTVAFTNGSATRGTLNQVAIYDVRADGQVGVRFIK